MPNYGEIKPYLPNTYGMDTLDWRSETAGISATPLILYGIENAARSTRRERNFRKFPDWGAGKERMRVSIVLRV